MPQQVVHDRRTLDDLAEFARAELAAGDIEPWAATLGALGLNAETTLWLVHLYNSTDDLSSTITIAQAAASPAAWVTDRAAAAPVAAGVALSGERRNLRGGKICRRLDSYTAALAGQPQGEWVREALIPGNPGATFDVLMPYLQRIWGVGRLAAFEWAEFLTKCGGYPIETLTAALWQSSGPRESLERLYNGGQPAPDPMWLYERAYECKQWLARQDAPLSWWDLETVICDFNVMRKGRYYPGKHLAMIRAEIDLITEPWQRHVLKAYRSVTPPGWRDLPGGVDRQLCQAYRQTGRIRMPELEVS